MEDFFPFQLPIVWVNPSSNMKDMHPIGGGGRSLPDV